MKESKGHFSTKVSEDQKEKLKEMYGGLSKWAKIQPGQTVNWQIDPNSGKEVTNKFNNPAVEFTIWDPEWDHEFTWQAPAGAAAAVINYLRLGYTFFKITKTGEGNDTRYKVEVEQ